MSYPVTTSDLKDVQMLETYVGGTRVFAKAAGQWNGRRCLWIDRCPERQV